MCLYMSRPSSTVRTVGIKVEDSRVVVRCDVRLVDVRVPIGMPCLHLPLIIWHAVRDSRQQRAGVVPVTTRYNYQMAPPIKLSAALRAPAQGYSKRREETREVLLKA
jgi:hypothetical protein